MRFFRKRVHESIAFSALLATALTLHVAWIANMLVHRSEVIRDWFTLYSEIGPITGLYAKTIITFFILFGLTLLFSRGTDLSEWRDRVFWFYLVSIIVFVVMTMPFVYEFSVLVE